MYSTDYLYVSRRLRRAGNIPLEGFRLYHLPIKVGLDSGWLTISVYGFTWSVGDSGSGGCCLLGRHDA